MDATPATPEDKSRPGPMLHHLDLPFTTSSMGGPAIAHPHASQASPTSEITIGLAATSPASSDIIATKATLLQLPPASLPSMSA